MGVVAGIGPWRLIEPVSHSDPELALLSLVDAGDITGALDGFKRQAAVDFASMLHLDDAAMVDAYSDGVPPGDLQWLSAEARTILAADLREALTSFDGYARDNVAWGATWDIEPAAASQPVALWYGDEDRLVSPDHGHWFAERIPSAHLTIRNGAGHGMTCFGYWDETFAALRTASGLPLVP